MAGTERIRTRLPYLEQFEFMREDHYTDSSARAGRAIASQELDNLHETEREGTLEDRIRVLEREIKKLKVPGGRPKSRPSVADLIMQEHQEQNEKEYHGKILAIDLESKSIAGVGETITEAFDQANKKTGKSQFAYRRVGSPAVHSMAH